MHAPSHSQNNALKYRFYSPIAICELDTLVYFTRQSFHCFQFTLHFPAGDFKTKECLKFKEAKLSNSF